MRYKKWDSYEITTTFDNTLKIFSWIGMTFKEAEQEVKYLAKDQNRKIEEFIITKGIK